MSLLLDVYIKTEPAVSGSGRERLKAALYGSQILFPGAQRVKELLPLLFAKSAVCAVATGSETEAQTHQYRRIFYYYIIQISIHSFRAVVLNSSPGI